MWDQQVENAVLAIYALFEQKRPVSIGFSGKDSTTVCALAFEAAKRASVDGLEPVLRVTTADTGIDNPVVLPHLTREMSKMRAYAELHNINFATKIARPTFLSGFIGKILTGTTIPSFPGSSECSVNYKVRPQVTARAELIAELNAQFPLLKLKKGQDNEMVVLIGTRLEESVKRASGMNERGESDVNPVRSQSGGLVMSPIMHWSLEDVWMFLLEHRDGQRTSYSDFLEIDEIYGDAGGGTTCGFKADEIFTEELSSGKVQSKSCGARLGCSLCTSVAEDKSADTMRKSNPEKYGFMDGLAKLRSFISNTRWDWSRRNWVGRTMTEDGYILVEPDTYSPNMVLDLWRYMISLQYAEIFAAAEKGIRPRFSFANEETAFMLDVYWSLAGYHVQGTALREFRNIMEGRAFYEVPDVAYVPRKPYTAGKIKVEGHWGSMAFGGLRSMEHEMAAFDTEGMLRHTKSGAAVPEFVIEQGTFKVHLESLYMAEDYESDRLEEFRTKGRYAEAYRFWVRYGAIKMNTTTAIAHDEMVARTAWRERMGIAGQQSPEKLLAMADPATLRVVGVDEEAERAAVEERKAQRLEKLGGLFVVDVAEITKSGKPAKPKPSNHVETPSANYEQMDMFA